MPTYGSGVYGSGTYGGATIFAVSEQDRWPDRVLITIQELAVGNIVTVTRQVSGSTVRTPVRGGYQVEATSDAMVLVDAEQPFGTLITYILTVDGVDLASAAITLTLEGGKVALSDAISGFAAEVVVLAWPDKRRTRDSGVYTIRGTNAVGRNIVVSGARGGFEGTIDLYTETAEQRENVEDLLASATSGILQIRQAGSYDGVDAYFSVTTDTVTRFSQDGSDQRRVISLDVVETGPWSFTLESPSFTLADIAAAYPSPDDLADLAADYGSLLAIAQGDWSNA